MIRELEITAYLFFHRVLFIIFRLFPLQEQTVFVASFPENTEYVANELARRNKEPIIVLCTCAPWKINLAKGDNIKIDSLSMRNPFIWLKGMYALATSRTIFVDNYFGFVAAKPFRSGVRCIQLWHAAGAIKRFGLEDQSNSTRSAKAHARFKKVYQSFTHIVCGSDKMAQIFEASFGTSESKMLHTGVPRTDFFFDNEKLEASKLKVRNELNLPDKKILLYAPTYRDEQLHVSKIALDLEQLERELSNTYILLLKLHPAVKVELDKLNEHFVMNVSNYPDINELLAAADILISDYSSIPFEFALLQKPMIFHAYDLQAYEQSRGFWEDYKNLVPGPVVDNTDGIITAIQTAQFDMNQVLKFSKSWNTYSNGQSSKKLIDALYRDNKNPEKCD